MRVSKEAARQKATLSSLFFFYFPPLSQPAFSSTLMPSLFNPLEAERRAGDVRDMASSPEMGVVTLLTFYYFPRQTRFLPAQLMTSFTLYLTRL